jgi:integrase
MKVPGCNTHKAQSAKTKDKKCPALCRRGCAGHALHCPSRTGGGLTEGQTKTEASDASIGLGSAVAELMRTHRATQQKWCQDKGVTWSDDMHVFTDDKGGPIDPRQDHRNWVALEKRAGVPHSKLSSARDTAGTFLFATGSDLRMIQQQLRHADLSMSADYTGVALEAQHAALNKVAAALMEGELTAILAARVAQGVA